MGARHDGEPPRQGSAPTARRLPSCRPRSPGDLYIVVVLDLQLAEIDAYGPHQEECAATEAALLRSDLDTFEDMDDVVVGVVRLEPPGP